MSRRRLSCLLYGFLFERRGERAHFGQRGGRAFLRLREWLGLANPEVFEHLLMQPQLAKLPKDVPLAVPETPRRDQVVLKFQQEYPGSFA